ncbi:hypothetical protein F2Q69_00030006 [Brassica cretica]|uniref:FBD domain-containing protein n=1 Tax=Brassica cretica TaxID=69181 RepID=A0A8S9RXD6_BRACR|nr:hypothetical protein F2Q69_00030006 [Brassica cretica]
MLVTSCLLQLLVSFFMEGKCSAACAAWCAEACHQLSNLSFVFCGRKPSSEATPYDIKYPLLSSGRPGNVQLLVSFFMEGKCSAACAAWFAKACHQLSNLSFVFCGSKPSSEATPYDIKYLLLSSGHPVRRVFSLKFISTKFILKLEEIVMSLRYYFKGLAELNYPSTELNCFELSCVEFLLEST